MASHIGRAVLLALAILLTACPGGGPEKADLVPERRSGAEGPQGFCQRDDDNLTVRVRNQANPDVLQQTAVRVDFGSFGRQNATAPAIPGGSFADVAVPIPAGCFNPDCDFTITVDFNDDVDEADETNNEEEGICIG